MRKHAPFWICLTSATLLFSAATGACAAEFAAQFINENYARVQQLPDGFHTPLKNRLEEPAPMSIESVKTISTAQLLDFIPQNRPVLVYADWLLSGEVDAYDDVIPGSVWLPNLGMHESKAADRAAQALAEKIKREKPDNYPVVVYCQNPHSWLSYNALMRLKRLGLKNLYWYRGGIMSWMNTRPALQTEKTTARIGMAWLFKPPANAIPPAAPAAQNSPKR